MEILAKSPVDAFISFTRHLLTIGNGREYGVLIKFPFEPSWGVSEEEKDFDAIFDEAFSGVKAWRDNEHLDWRHWLARTGFPLEWYFEYGEDFEKFLKDERLVSRQYSGKGKHTTDMGNIARVLKNGRSYMQYVLERWKDPNHRSQPTYYFDTVPGCEWYWEELMRNPKQVKTGRSSAACCSNIYFRWMTEQRQPIVGWIMKHCNWTHLYEDLFPPKWMGVALCKHFGFHRGEVNVFFVSITLDDKKKAREIVEGWDLQKKEWEDKDAK